MSRRALVVSVLALVLSVSWARASGLDVDVEGYRRSPERTTVSGRVWQERRQPNEPDRPVTTAVVTLFPRSKAFLDRLGALKTRSRDSMAAYRSAAPAMRRERDGYETALWEAGAPDLVRATLVDPDGRFAFQDVPAGPWLVFGWSGGFVQARSPAVRRQDRRAFMIGRGVEGYEAVTVWLREIAVGGEGSGPIDLTDRNAWFSGVAESEAPSTGH